ncbi:hypothetical protein K439DRAFT_1131557 [Ramaria rubella]|nr:hypothetical protein K439DRAFT_1131557 [Ramaria rubella]
MYPAGQVSRDVSISLRLIRTALHRPAQNQPEKAGFQGLAEELINEVLRYLHWPTDYYNISLVSRTLYRLATHELYSTIVIAYHRPHRISALLSLLQLKPERARLITTLIFDEEVKSIGPKIWDEDEWPPQIHRRDLADGWNPRSNPRDYPHSTYHERIAKQLKNFLKSLPNLRRIIMRSLHPSYMNVGLFDDKAAETTSNGELIKDPTHSNLWSCIFNGSPLVSQLFLNGIATELPTSQMLSRLTTICISDLYWDLTGHSQQADMWNRLLSHAHSLNTLGMVNVEHAHTIINERFFPHLEALELYNVFLGEPLQSDSPIFTHFLHLHSPTLRILALCSHLWWSIDHNAWLSDKDILPNLHTLRLENICALLGKVDERLPVTDEEFEAVLDVRDTVQSQRTKIMIDFVAHRPNILDIGISALATIEADKFAEYLATTRQMRNILIGSAANRSLQTHLPRLKRYYVYSYDAWAFYKLFGGLTICQSGFRPRLPHKGWQFWKKG